jgi:hopene-associated glycosyltransferase HpnB
MSLGWETLPAATLALWTVILLAPWRPWRTVERLDGESAGDSDLSEVTALVPARNEAQTIARALSSLHAQGSGLHILLVDDQSTDATAQIARNALPDRLTVISGAPLPSGWTGKLWALEQGWRQASSPLVLLMDADIELAPGTVAALRRKLRSERLGLVSLMAAPRFRSLWERLLMPAFVYFFKLLYPFRLANSRQPWVAAAAGGCILLDAQLLEKLGGFEAIRGAIIDDCALARRAKAAGHRTWIGLTRSARMLRHSGLRDIWEMVSRTAFTQLRYSAVLLALCSVLMLLAFAAPVAGLAFPGWSPTATSAMTWAVMAGTYVPLVRFYRLSPAWALTLPAAGILYLAMTWTSTLRYWKGQRSRWKDRTYSSDVTSSPNAVRRQIG